MKAFRWTVSTLTGNPYWKSPLSVKYFNEWGYRFGCLVFRSARFSPVPLRVFDWVKGLGLQDWWFWKFFIKAGAPVRLVFSWIFLTGRRKTYLSSIWFMYLTYPTEFIYFIFCFPVSSFPFPLSIYCSLISTWNSLINIHAPCSSSTCSTNLDLGRFLLICFLVTMCPIECQLYYLGGFG